MSEDSDHFSLRWNNFHSNLTSGFHSLLQSEDLVDVTLAAGGQFIQAHKIVLSVCSPYFKQLFKVNPCKHPIVILKDVSYKELVSILQFMYKGEVNVRQEELSDFLKTAETLQIKGLTGDEPPAEDQPAKPPQNATPPPVARTIDRPFKRRSITPSHSPKPPSSSSALRTASVKRPRVVVAGNLTPVPNLPNIPNDVAQFVAMNTPKCEPADYDSDIEELDSKSEAMVRLLEGETSLSHQDDADSHQSHYDSPLQQVDASPSHLQSLGSSIHALMEPSPAGISNVQGMAGNSQTPDPQLDGSQGPQNIAGKVVRRYQCYTCPKTFLSAQSVQRHVENIHGSLKGPFKCDICEKMYKNMNTLISHLHDYHLIKTRDVTKVGRVLKLKQWQ